MFFSISTLKRWSYSLLIHKIKVVSRRLSRAGLEIINLLLQLDHAQFTPDAGVIEAFQLRVAGAQRILCLLALGDVGVCAEPADHVAILVVARHYSRQEGPKHAVTAEEREDHVKWFSG